MTNTSTLHFSKYIPGKFEYLMKEPFTQELWNQLTNHVNMQLMIQAASENKPAIQYLLKNIENEFDNYLSSNNYPDGEVEVLINNMIKQIMMSMGYEHIACGFIREARYIKSSGIYSKSL